MEKQSLLRRLCAAINILLTYGVQHAASLAAMEKTYMRCVSDGGTNDPCKILLNIRRSGQLYEVTLGYFTHDQFKVSEKWLATYGWHSNGHLIAIGRCTYVIFDPVRKLVIIERIPEQGPDTVEIFHEA
jgi:hypothetical protein